jgi:acyl-CoA dehydrogenase
MISVSSARRSARSGDSALARDVGERGGGSAFAAIAACRAADHGEAKLDRSREAARGRAVSVTSIAHQVHGAIGFTAECRLHFATQRLWAWRSEYGNDRYWAAQLGDATLRQGPDRFWPHLTSLTDSQLQH